MFLIVFIELLHRSKKTSKFRKFHVTGLYEGNPPVTPPDNEDE